MSKIFSSPKIPSTPAMYYAPTESRSTNTAPTETPNKNQPETNTDEERVNNILARRRGRTGTIGTSFRGTLTDSINSITTPVRKTLLGD